MYNNIYTPKCMPPQMKFLATPCPPPPASGRQLVLPKNRYHIRVKY